MSNFFELDEPRPKALGARIKVVGVGGAGGNAINTMINSRIEGVEFIVANTDEQALAQSLAPHKIQLGSSLTAGRGAGAKPDVGRAAALENERDIAEAVAGADMVFVAAGMGGGTGTGAAPVVAEIARSSGALTVAVVTRPFMFEGRKRSTLAECGIADLRGAVDSLLVVPNDRLLALGNERLTMVNAFQAADSVLSNAVRGISDIITEGGYVNVDFADVKTIMSNQGLALMGTGIATGENAAYEAAEQAISSPLLDDVTIDGATGILIHYAAGVEFSVHELGAATALIQESAHPDAMVIFGTTLDEGLGEEVRVTVIATGFDRAADASPADETDALDEARFQPQRRYNPVGAPQVERRDPVSRPVPARSHSVATPATAPARPAATPQAVTAAPQRPVASVPEYARPTEVRSELSIYGYGGGRPARTLDAGRFAEPGREPLSVGNRHES
jgi:cell division protein FtsZ